MQADSRIELILSALATALRVIVALPIDEFSPTASHFAAWTESMTKLFLRRLTSFLRSSDGARIKALGRQAENEDHGMIVTPRASLCIARCINELVGPASSLRSLAAGASTALYAACEGEEAFDSAISMLPRT